MISSLERNPLSGINIIEEIQLLQIRFTAIHLPQVTRAQG